jgi:hypothetical protein
MRSWAAVERTIAATEAIRGPDVQKAVSVVTDTLQKLEAANEAVGRSRFPLAVNNVIAGIADSHLEALYLLQQRAV